MLQKLNERLQGMVAWLIIVLIAITFTLFGVDYYLQNHQISNVKILVNDQAISTQAFETQYRRSRSRLDSTLTSADEKRLQAQVLNEMIKNEATLQAAQRYGFDVSLSQANTAIMNIPQFQEDGHFSTQKYELALNAALFTPESFQNEVRQGMLLNQQRFAFIGSSFALPSEIKRFVSLYMQKRDYDYLGISPSLFANQVKVSEEEIQSYYQSHSNEFFTPEKVSLEYLSLSLRDIKNKLSVSDDEINRYYDENKQNFLAPAQWKVAHILFAVPKLASASDAYQIQQKAENAFETLKKDPQQFNKLVDSLSDDKQSSAAHGELPWISGGQKDYDKILTSLTKAGEINNPVRTKNGFEIFKLIDYKPTSIKPLTEVASQIKEQLLSEMAQSKYTKAMEQLSDLSYQTPDSLTPVAEALKLPLQKTEAFSRLGGTTVLTKMKPVVNAAFNHEVLDLNNNSEPIQISNDAVVVFRISKHFKAKKQDVSEVQDQIEKKLSQEKMQTLAKELGSKLIQANDTDKFLELMKDYQLQWHSVVQVSRENSSENTERNDLAFSLLKPGSIRGMSLSNGDYVVIKLKQIINGKLASLDKEQTDSLIQQIEANYGMMDYDFYVSGLMKQAKIVEAGAA